MEATDALIVITIIYGVLLFFDNFFKTCAHYPYLKFLEGTGFQISFFTIKWQTKAFNRTLIRWGTYKPRFLNAWFNFGLVISLVFLPLAVILLLYSVAQNFSDSKQEKSVVLEPLIPGVNLPSSELGYYSGTIILASVVHELGHALAAVLDDVNLVEVGTNIFFILPVAYVNLSTDKLLTLPHKRTLRIICAGIWHNLILSLIAVILYLLLPIIFSLVFHVNRGITVTQIAKNSPVFGSKGLMIGDRVFQINECKVTDEYSWYDCLSQVKSQQMAFCIDSQIIHNLDESIPLRHSEFGNLECCDEKKLKNICFEYLDSSNGILELPTHACLPARTVVEKSPLTCSHLPHSCPDNNYCFKPIPGNSTYLMKLICKDKTVIYLGRPEDIARTSEVSSYIPKFLFKTTDFPDIVTKFTKYLSVISFGLAIVNVLPFLYMDGQYIMEILGHMLLSTKMRNEKYKLVISIITMSFTLILILHCVYFFYNKILL